MILKTTLFLQLMAYIGISHSTILNRVLLPQTVLTITVPRAGVSDCLSVRIQTLLISPTGVYSVFELYLS